MDCHIQSSAEKFALLENETWWKANLAAEPRTGAVSARATAAETA
jgi:hypothetical protein